MNNSCDLKIKNALLKIAEYRIKYIESFPEVQEEYSDNYNARIKTIIDYSKKTSTAKPRKIIAKVILIAAVITALLATAIACIPSIRHYVVEWTEKYFSVTPVTDDLPPEIIMRTKIEQVYLPHSIPNGYELIESMNDEFTVSSIWMKDVDMITYEQIPNDSSLAIDSEADYHQIIINKCEVNYAIKHGLYMIIWENDGYIFSMTCSESLGFETVKELIGSVAPIQ